MRDRTQEAKKVTWVGFFVNLGLTMGKLFAGIVGHSAAMVADGVHSLSDFATDIVVLLFVNVSGKESDEDHKYGHGKFETFATLIISLALFAVGTGIFINGLEEIVAALKGKVIDQPSMIAFWAAIASIIVKELLYRYTIIVGKRINNQAVIANGWHHRSDAFSSIGTALGIGGAIFLGSQFKILDPLAGVVVSVFIAKVSIELGMPSVKELLEAALPKEVEEDILDIVRGTKGVLDFHHFKTRKIGSNFVIDIHIQLDSEITFVHSHDIATEIEHKLRSKYGKNTQISIHTEPFKNR